jgi:uncharacterized membrane protein
MGIGATLAVLANAPFSNKVINNLLSVIGLLLILIPALILQKKVHFRV